MKIYCDRRHKDSPFDQFVGKPVWVKVSAFWGDITISESYLRILRKSGDFYDYCEAPWTMFDKGYLTAAEFYDESRKVRCGDLSDYKIFEPCEIYTLAEMADGDFV